MIQNEADQTINNEVVVSQILGADTWDHLREPESSARLFFHEPGS
jgi:hypothetical protein